MTSCNHPHGNLPVVGTCENNRNLDNSDIYKAIIREAYGVHDVICGHHLIYEAEMMGDDGSVYHFPQEMPSADALIFNHDVARKIWGDNYLDFLMRFACEPVETRDALLAKLYYGRKANV